MSGDSTAGTFEECADELNDFLATLERYPHTVLAYALRVHLCGMLQALRTQGEWSDEDLEVFMEEMTLEVRESTSS
jgi:hypothetical protein